MLNVGQKNYVPEKFPRLQHQTISLDIGIFFNGTFNGATTFTIMAVSTMTLGNFKHTAECRCLECYYTKCRGAYSTTF